ncbi:hypothetical protein A6R68_23847 [Neotoma lepida]|uniref:Grh/CP2 DB domain-containing protein n=1 Tax=Neotoma lepida TaxID=56216 RepID=A0A1A6HUN8_NEOLE|nr:hypothetical protein A6R68_23847 [Neotoma lepida]
MLDNRKMGDIPEISGKLVKSLIRVVFQDRRLQYTEHQQLEGWKWNRPGDRLLDLNIPMSVGIIDTRTNPSQLNAVEFLWDPAKCTSAFIQVHCISTECTPRKHGGEKGVPFRIQVDTFKQIENGEYTDHLHSASCQIKVFKPKGADRKQKTDREKMEKRTAHGKEKYQPSYDTTILTECSPWPDTPTAYVNNSPSPAPTFTSSQQSMCSVPDSNSSSPNHQADGVAQVSGEQIQPSATTQKTQQWLLKNRFSSYTRLFSNFSDADLLRLTKGGFTDGIRLYNSLKSRSVRPRLTIYVCQEQPNSIVLQGQPQAASSGGENGSGTPCIYHAIYLEEMVASEVAQKLASVFNTPFHQINQVYRQGATGIHIVVSDQMVQNFQDESCFFILHTQHPHESERISRRATSSQSWCARFPSRGRPYEGVDFGHINVIKFLHRLFDLLQQGSWTLPPTLVELHCSDAVPSSWPAELGEGAGGYSPTPPPAQLKLHSARPGLELHVTEATSYKHFLDEKFDAKIILGDKCSVRRLNMSESHMSTTGHVWTTDPLKL